MSEDYVEALLAQSGQVRALARTLVRDPHRADDIAQEAWVAAYAQPPLRPAALPSWLMTVVRRLAAREQRAEHRRRKREATAARAEALPSTREILEREASRRALVEAVLELEEPYRSTVVLRYLEELPPREVARRLGVPVETVRTRTKRALVRLREKLDAEHGGDRRAWIAALLPLVGPRSGVAGGVAGAAGFLVLGGLTMKYLVGIGAVIVGVMLWAVLGGSPEAEGGPPRPVVEPPATMHAVVPAEAEAPAAPAVREPLMEEPAAAPTTGGLLVRVKWQDDQSAACEVLVVATSGPLLPEKDPLVERREGWTDERGEIRFEGMPPGRWLVSCVRQSLKDMARATVEVGVRAEVDIALAGVTVRGVVVDQGGQPVSDAEVLVAPWVSRPRALTRSDAQGRFELRAVASNSSVGARREGYAPSVMHRLSGSEGASIELHLVLPGAGAAVSGTVLGPDGGAVVGAAVQVGDRMQAMRVLMLPDGSHGRSQLPLWTWTDDDGRFAFAALDPGPQRLAIRARHLGPWQDEFEVAAGETKDILVQLELGVTLTGTVRGEDDAPIADADVRVGELLDFAMQWGRTDRKGSYGFEGVGSGELVVTASHDDHGRIEETLRAPAGETIHWDPQLSSGVTFLGRVVDERGAPMPHARIEARSDDALPDGWTGHAYAGEDGRFVLRNCDRERPMRLDVGVDSMFAAVQLGQLLPGGEELEITVADAHLSSVRLAGRVVDSEGRPVDRVSVATVRRGGSGSPSDTTEAGTGRFDLGPYPPGEYQLVLRAAGYAPLRTKWRQVRQDETCNFGDLQLQPPGTLRVTLLDTGDLDRSSLSASIRDDDGGWHGWLSLETGVARSDALAPGSYRLQVQGPEVAAGSHPFTVRAHEEAQLELELTSGTPVTVRFDAAGRAPRIVRVRIEDASGSTRLHTYAYRRKGIELALALAPGTYQVHGSTDGGLAGSSELVVGTEPGAPLDIPLR